MDNKKRNKIILDLACELLNKMNFEINKAAVEDSNDEGVLVSVEVNNPAVLIGFKGKNLAAVQLILTLIIKNKLGNWVKIILDVNQYRKEQKARLEAMTISLAEKVLATGKPVTMANMSSYERRICHLVVAGRKGIITESEGEGEARHIVIKPET